MDRHQLGGQEGVVAVVDGDDAVVRHLAPQFIEEARGIDDIGGIVAIPALAIGGLVAPICSRNASFGCAPRHLGFQLRRQLLQHRAGIACDGDLGRIIRVEDIRIDVDVNEVLRHLGAVAAGRDLREARADRDHAVAIPERVLRRRHRGGAEAEADMQRMIGGKHGQPLQGRRNRRLQPFGKAHEFGASRRACPSRRRCRDAWRRAATRAARRDLAPPLRRAAADGGWNCGRFTGLIGQQEDVDRQLHEHRTGLARGRDPVGLEQCRHHLVMAGDAERRLGQPAHEFVGVHLVQLVAMAGIGARAAATAPASARRRERPRRCRSRHGSGPRPGPPSARRWNRRAGRRHRP